MHLVSLPIFLLYVGRIVWHCDCSFRLHGYRCQVTESKSHRLCRVTFWNEDRWKIRGGPKQGVTSTEDVNAPSQTNTTIKTSLSVKENEEGWGPYQALFYWRNKKIEKIREIREISCVLWWKKNNVPVLWGLRSLILGRGQMLVVLP